MILIITENWQYINITDPTNFSGNQETPLMETRTNKNSLESRGPGGWRDFFWLEAVGKILTPKKGQRWPYDIYDTVDG